jgi:hypothetical protein
MAPNVEAIIQEGISAIKAGRKDDARRALMKAVDLDERNETAWLWLSAVVDTPDEQQLCLENVLSINPSNQKAQRGLEALKKASGQKPKPAAPAPTPTSAAASPFDSGFDSNPFAGTGFDSNPYGSSADPVLGSGWGGFDTADSASTAPATSVDWNRGSGPAVYGSGKEVQLPSSEEYDNWVSGLQLGGNSAAGDASFGSGFDSSFDPSSGPFASSFDDSADPFGGSSTSSAVQDPFGVEQGAVDPFGAPATRSSSPFGDFDAPGTPSFGSDPFGGSDDLFNAGSADPFGGSSAFGTPGRSDPFAAPDPFDKPAPAAKAAAPASSGPFGRPFAAPAADTFDKDPVADLFSSVPGPGTAKTRTSAAPPPVPASSNPFGPSQPSVFGSAPPALDDDFGASGPASGGFAFSGSGASGMQVYFKAIPPEIQPAKRRSQGGGGSARLVLTVIVLAVLNMVSLAYLVKTLMGR